MNDELFMQKFKDLMLVLIIRTIQCNGDEVKMIGSIMEITDIMDEFVKKEQAPGTTYSLKK